MLAAKKAGTDMSIDKTPPSNIFLVGPMGVGKTTIGRTLAEELRLEFVDLMLKSKRDAEPRSPGFSMLKAKPGSVTERWRCLLN